MVNRDERQNTQVSDWATKFSARGFLIAATGYGKSHVAIKSIQLCNERDVERKIHVVVPTSVLKEAWVKKKKGHIDKYKLKNVEVFVVNTYVKMSRECDLLICDELHRYSNEKAYLFSKVVGETKYNWFLGLSATLEQHHLNFLSLKNIKKIDEVPLSECKANGWVSDFEVVNFGVELDEVDKAYYDGLHKAFNKHFAIFNHDFDVAMQCLCNTDFRTERARQLGVEPKRLMIEAVLWNKNMRERKEFLYHCHAKMMVGKELSKLDKHIIGFSESVKFIEELKQEIGDNAVTFHSKNGVKANREALKKFTDRRTRVNCLLTAKAMDEGFDAPDANLAIIYSRTSKQLQQTQRVGRLIRSQEGKKAYIVNLYVKNSQDEVWLKKASKGMKCLWLDDLELLKTLINGRS